jgi:hypothetical protein
MKFIVSKNKVKMKYYIARPYFSAEFTLQIVYILDVQYKKYGER